MTVDISPESGVNMSKKELVCAQRDCEQVFVPKTHNMKYCSDECCRLETNARIMEKYYAKRDQKLGKTRYCRVCNKTKLSRYNDSQICSACELESNMTRNSSVIDMFLNTSFIA